MRATSSQVAGVVSGGAESAWQAVMVARKAFTVAASAISDPCFSAPALLAERTGRVFECQRGLVLAERAYRVACEREREAAA